MTDQTGQMPVPAAAGNPECAVRRTRPRPSHIRAIQESVGRRSAGIRRATRAEILNAAWVR